MAADPYRSDTDAPPRQQGLLFDDIVPTPQEAEPFVEPDPYLPVLNEILTRLVRLETRVVLLMGHSGMNVPPTRNRN